MISCLLVLRTTLFATRFGSGSSAPLMYARTTLDSTNAHKQIVFATVTIPRSMLYHRFCFPFYTCY